MKTLYSMTLLGTAAASLLWLGATSTSAEAYTVWSRFTPGCHEKITSEALRTVRLDSKAAVLLPLTAEEQALVDDLEFTPSDDMKDLGGVTLLIGVRDNDLKQRASDDLSQLALIHGNPNNQDEHCLRSKSQDEPDGSVAALDDCRNFILGRVAEALDGLDENGFPDVAKRTSLPMHLSLRGTIDVSLPTYYVRIGQAIHAVEDSYTHTYRTPDQAKITVVLNWIDDADGTLKESRDGPAHASLLDTCNDADELRKDKRIMATEAATALLRATLDQQQTKEEKMVTVEGILDKYMSYSPGCTFDNNWCDASERQYKNPGSTIFGCTSGRDGLAAGICSLFGLTMLTRRRRKVASVIAGLVVAGALVLAGGNARAQGPGQHHAGATEPAAQTDQHEPPPPVTTPVVEPGPSDPSEGAWGAYLGASGSVDKPGFAGQLGLRRRVSTQWTFGWDVEWNPWVSVSGPTPVRAGVISTYGTVILRFPLAYESFNLRTTLSLGASYLMIDLYGAPKGSIGLYGAISPLGLEWKVSRAFLLIINPMSVAVPVPQIRGVPLTYPQYRFSIGLGILAG